MFVKGTSEVFYNLFRCMLERLFLAEVRKRLFWALGLLGAREPRARAKVIEGRARSEEPYKALKGPLRAL